MNELFGIPVDTLLVILARRARRLRSATLGHPRAAQPDPPEARRPQRRRAGAGRTALIVVGLMLGTTIIAAALTTGDTMSHTIRATAVDALGATDETIAPRGRRRRHPRRARGGDRRRLVRRAVGRRGSSPRSARSDLVDGVTGAIVEQVAVQAPAHAPERAERRPLRRRPGTDGGLLARSAAPTARRSRSATSRRRGLPEPRRPRPSCGSSPATAVVVVRGAATPHPARVRDVVDFDGAGTADAALLVPLATAQAALRPSR